MTRMYFNISEAFQYQRWLSRGSREVDIKLRDLSEESGSAFWRSIANMRHTSPPYALPVFSTLKVTWYAGS
jgi:hypothetical protein